MNDTYLISQPDIDPSASSGESSSASRCPLEEIFQVTEPRWKTKERVRAWVPHKLARTIAGSRDRQPLPLSWWTKWRWDPQEGFANVETCGEEGPGRRTRSVQLCQGLLVNRRTPSAASPSRRETNCERYWLPRQICAVQRVNKMDGVVRLSSGEVLWQHASGRVQQIPG